MLSTFLNKVTQGDCLKLMKELPNQSIDMILCDLPYGTTKNEWDQVIDLDVLWTQYKRIIKPNGVIALTASSVFTARLIMSNLEMFKYKITWIKSRSVNFLNVNKQPLRRHEDICIFYQRQPPYRPQMSFGAPYDKGLRKGTPTGCYGKFHSSIVKSDGQRYPSDVIFIEEEHIEDWFYCKTAETEPRKPVHPSQKPVELGQYLIRTFTNPGAIILDNACGSGSFLIAAIREDRQFIGMEKNQAIYYLKYQPVDIIQYCNERIKTEYRSKTQSNLGQPP